EGRRRGEGRGQEPERRKASDQVPRLQGRDDRARGLEQGEERTRGLPEAQARQAAESRGEGPPRREQGKALAAGPNRVTRRPRNRGASVVSCRRGVILLRRHSRTQGLRCRFDRRASRVATEFLAV